MNTHKVLNTFETIVRFQKDGLLYTKLSIGTRNKIKFNYIKNRIQFRKSIDKQTDILLSHKVVKERTFHSFLRYHQYPQPHHHQIRSFSSKSNHEIQDNMSNRLDANLSTELSKILKRLDIILQGQPTNDAILELIRIWNYSESLLLGNYKNKNIIRDKIAHFIFSNKSELSIKFISKLYFDVNFEQQHNITLDNAKFKVLSIIHSDKYNKTIEHDENNTIAINNEERILKELESLITNTIKTKGKILTINILSSSIEYLIKSENINKNSIDNAELLLKLWLSTVLKIHGSAAFLESTFPNTKEQRLLLKILQSSNHPISLLRRFIRPKNLNESNTTSVNTAIIFSNQMASAAILGYLETLRDWRTVIKIWMLQKDEYREKRDLTCVMRAYIKINEPKKALALYRRFPNLHEDRQFDPLISAYGKIYDWNNMQQTFEGLFGKGELPNLLHYSIVMNALAKNKNLDLVNALWNQVLERKMAPNKAIFEAVIRAYYHNNEPETALKWFEKMINYKVQPDISCFSLILEIFRLQSDTEASIMLLNRLIIKKYRVDVRNFTTVIDCCAKTKDYLTAELIFNWMIRYGIQPDAYCCNTLMTTYRDAQQYEKIGYVYKFMIHENITPGIETFTILTTMYAGLKNPNGASIILNEMESYGVLPDKTLYAELINLLIETQSVEEAEEMINSMSKKKSTVKATATQYYYLLKYYCHNIKYIKVIELYGKMLKAGIKPDYRCDALLIKAQTKLNIRTKSDLNSSIALLKTLLDQKKKEDNGGEVLTPQYSPLLFSELIKGLSKSGQFNEARELIDIYEKSSNLRSLSSKNDHNRTTPTNTIIMLQTLISYYGEANDWENVETAFDKLLSILKRKYIPHENTSYDKNVGVNKLICPSKYRMSLNGILTYKFKQLANYNKFNEITPLLLSLRKSGFQFTNSVMNEVVQLLSTDTTSIEDALMLTEELLIGGFIRLRLIRKEERENAELTELLPRPFFYLSYVSFDKLRKAFDRYMEFKQDRGEGMRTMEKLRRKYPGVLKAFKKREEMIEEAEYKESIGESVPNYLMWNIPPGSQKN